MGICLHDDSGVCFALSHKFPFSILLVVPVDDALHMTPQSRYHPHRFSNSPCLQSLFSVSRGPLSVDPMSSRLC